MMNKYLSLIESLEQGNVESSNSEVKVYPKSYAK